MNKKDPRVIRTLERIDQSLLENLNSYDFRKITVDMLCRSAKINRSTFYKYYTDKYELLDDYLNRVLSEFSEATYSTGFIKISPYDLSSKEYIESFVKMIDYIYRHLDIYRILWNAHFNRSIYKEMEDLIRKNVLKIIQDDITTPPQDKTECYQELYARFFASNFLTLVRWWLANQPFISKCDVLAVMKGSIRNSLLATLPKENES